MAFDVTAYRREWKRRHRQDPDNRDRTNAYQRAYYRQTAERQNAARRDRYRQTAEQRNAARRDRRRQKKEAEEAARRAIESAPSFAPLPVRPLIEYVDRLIARRNALANQGLMGIDGNGGTTEVANTLGVTERTLHAWRTGERKHVEFDMADRILQAAGWMWWDVWTEETVTLPILTVRFRRRVRNGWSIKAPVHYGDRRDIPPLDLEGYEATDWETLARIEHDFSCPGCEKCESAMLLELAVA